MSLLAALPHRVRVVEVGPRDGLQNEGLTVPTAAKLAFIARLAEAGLREIEVTSFVSPRAVPQLADADTLFPSLPIHAGVRYSALVPNQRGMERALAAGARAIAIFTAASESFARRNINMRIAESIEAARPVVARARAERIFVRAYISTAFGCPYEGAVAAAQVVRVAEQLAELGVDELSIGDTIGVATPRSVEAVVAALRSHLPALPLAVHFHDTRGAALANVLIALQLGVDTVDAAAGGLGGCPFAPGASGNLATEDLVGMLNGMGIETGVSLDGVCRAARAIGESLGHQPVSRAYAAWRAARVTKAGTSEAVG